MDVRSESPHVYDTFGSLKVTSSRSPCGALTFVLLPGSKKSSQGGSVQLPVNGCTLLFTSNASDVAIRLPDCASSLYPSPAVSTLRSLNVAIPPAEVCVGVPPSFATPLDGSLANDNA